MAQATLLQIQQKVRLLTRKPDQRQLTDAQLNQYINTFLQFNFPQQLRLYNLRRLFKFYTQPNVAEYSTETDDPNSNFYNFNQKVIAIHPPVFFAGIQGYFTQYRDQFYSMYPQFNTVNNETGLYGNGTLGPFIGTVLQYNLDNIAPLNVPSNSAGILQNNVIISTIDDNNKALILIDYPINSKTGYLGVQNSSPATAPLGLNVGTTNGGGSAAGTVPSASGVIGQYFIISSQVFIVVANSGTLETSGSGTGTFDTSTGDFSFSGVAASSNIIFYDVPSYGTINYLTGAFVAIFPSITGTRHQPIVATSIPYQTGKPIAALFYEQKFIIRPVPDKVYSIEFEADYMPTELLSATDMPQIEQWWQYVAYGAARLIFQDNMDLDSVQLIEPEFREQEMLVQRATLMVKSNTRTETVFTQAKNYGNGGFGPVTGWPY